MARTIQASGSLANSRTFSRRSAASRSSIACARPPGSGSRRRRSAGTGCSKPRRWRKAEPGSLSRPGVKSSSRPPSRSPSTSSPARSSESPRSRTGPRSRARS